MISDLEHVSTWLHLAVAVPVTAGLLWALSDMPTTSDGWRCLLRHPHVSGLHAPPRAPTYTTEPEPPFDWGAAIGLGLAKVEDPVEVVAIEAQDPFEALYADSGLDEIVQIVTWWVQAVRNLAQELQVSEERVYDVLRDFVILRSES